MAYCSYCAAVLDPTQPACARCGNATGAVAVPSMITSAGQRPSSIRIAVILLLICSAIGFLSIANLYLTYRPAPSPIFLVRTIGLSILMIGLVIGLWNRQGWTRIGIVLLIAWALGNVLFTIIRLNVAVWTFAIPLAIDAVRLCAVFLMFKPESNAWLKK